MTSTGDTPHGHPDRDGFRPAAAVIAGHAASAGGRTALIVLDRGEAEAERLDYAGLEVRVRAAAAVLAAAVPSGAPVVLALPTGADFVVLLLACLRVGAVAVPVPYPDTDRALDRIAGILADCRPALVATRPEAVGRIARAASASGHSPAILVPEDCTRGAAPAPAAGVDPDAPAIVQYTSGSTRRPTGIALTQRNIAANQAMIRAAFGIAPPAVAVGWLPHFHDMGLFGLLLQPLWLGSTAVVMAPRDFLQKPARWLAAIDRYGAVCSGAPAFGYDLCTRRIDAEAARRLDLSGWRIAFCGAEPIRPAILDRFAAAFGPVGFQARAFLPCYGLAEATLLVAAGRPGEGVRTVPPPPSRPAVRPLAMCGRATTGGALALRTPSGALSLAPGLEGEICIAGDHVAPGTWDGAARAIVPFADAFAAPDGRRWLPTGDVGLLVDGELVPLDRVKDMVVLYGAKHHAADIEAVALEAAPPGPVLAAAAFALDGAERERLVVCCEVERGVLRARAAPLERAVAERIAAGIGLVAEVVAVPAGSLPRTSSGKIARHACRTEFLAGRIGRAERPAAAEAAPA